MAKRKSQWRCTACDASHGGWFGRCPDCGAWNTVVEAAAAPAEGTRVVLTAAAHQEPVPSTAAQEALDAAPRMACGLPEVDRVLGGGLVPGSVVLLGGAPGIGKSTLLLQVGAQLAAMEGPVLYASGEESVAQVAGRAQRLEAAHERLLLLAETRIEAVLDAARARKDVAAVVIDSIQTMYSEAQDGLPGNLSQVRAVTGHLVSFAKSAGVPVVVVGHITKDGQLAGPRLLEHMVDAVLSFEGDDDHATRMLRSTKNRFGSTDELGVFLMTETGLRQVQDPSGAFVSQRSEPAIGACVTATLEGSRPLMVEIQALLGQSYGSNPRRTCVGLDATRVAMLLAVLDRHAGLFVLDHDVFANVAGGMRITEPAADLAALAAIASSHTRKPVPSGSVVLGEVGLTGELRPVRRAEARAQEAARLGMKRIILPKARGQRVQVSGIEVVAVEHVKQALEVLMDV